MLVPIGRFSQMTRLSVKALRLYDENGLLPAAYVDPSSGYRYYQLDQARSAEIIRILRSIDMPLDDIRVVLNTNDTEQVGKQLLVHRERLTERMAVHRRMLTHLESIMRDQKRLMPYDVHVMEVKRQCIATVKKHTTINKIGDDVSACFRALVSGLGRAGVSASGPPMIVYHHVIDAESEGDIEVCVPVRDAFPGDAEVDGRELEGGTMATIEHRGPYEELGPAYHTLAGWVIENGYEIVGAPREVYLNDPRTVAPEKLLTRVEFPMGSDEVALPR